MNNNNHLKILKDYHDYLKSKEATVVFIAKNLADKLDTKNKWVDVVDLDSWGSRGEKFAFNYFIVELFERKIHPVYPKDADLRLCKAITWKTAHDDIEQQRTKGMRGSMFLITCHLFNKNKGKKVTQYFDNWNEEYGGFDHTGKVPTTTISREVDLKPEWEYRITGIKEIDDTRYQYIKVNYNRIYARILEEKHVSIDWFFDSYPTIMKEKIHNCFEFKLLKNRFSRKNLRGYTAGSGT